MSMRYQAGIVLPGYNPLKVANAPTIGAITQASVTSASVAFTAPSCIGGGAISSYTAFACCGVKLTSGASSPLVVTGLTTGSAYTFKVVATNVYGPSYPSAASSSFTPVPQSQQAYTTAGTYSWVAPTGVTSVSVVTVGGGGGAGGGGALTYKNNITVVPGNSYSVVVGAGGVGGSGGGQPGTNGGNSSFTAGFGTMTAGGGNGATTAAGGAPSGTYDAGYSGGVGAGGNPGYNGGGAGGYAGAGGAGSFGGSTGGTGGAGGAGAWPYQGGGGVGLLGQGSSGGPSGGGGSGGSSGTTPNGGVYGGASGGNPGGGIAGVGAVRIIWPGTTRSFPSTNTGDL